MSLRVAIVAAMVMCAVAAGAPDRAPRVFAAGESSDDIRLRQARDLDHPFVFEPDFQEKSQWQARAKRLREQVLVAEGLWPLPAKTPVNAVIHGKIDRDAYTIEKVFFASYPGHYVSGNLYRPKNRTGKLPAVLSPHGHWNNGRMYEAPDKLARKNIADGGESTLEGAKFPLQARCAMLARMGCIVFHYDMVGYADSTQIEHRTGFTDAEAILRLQSFMGLQTWNSIRALDFVANLPDVDTSRIAVTGASGGGTQTFILGAIDDRPAVEFPAVMVGEAMQGGCICENAPLLRIDTNNVELAAAFAPKPLGMTAANDWTREMESVAYPKIRSIYALFGAESDVLGRHFPFEHNYNQVSREMMYNWFNDHLKLGWPSPVKEEAFVPVPPKELSVYDDEHPRPADSSNASELRKYMSESSDRQLDQMWKNQPEEYRQTLTAALRVMVDDSLPEAAQVERSRQTQRTLAEGSHLEMGTLTRKGSGEAVPYVRLTPEKWNGTVIVWADPAGKSALFESSDRPASEAAYLLGRGNAILAADLFLTGEAKRPGAPTTRPAAARNEGQNYAGFLYGYNRSVLANRVHDLLTVIALAHGDAQTRRIELLASGSTGPAALLARVMADDVIDRAAIDLGEFDFDHVTDPMDEMMLPGALKYGGINGFAALCGHGTTLLTGGRRDTDSYARLVGAATVSLRVEHADYEDLVDWLERK
ncbi:MAG TPA: acetylxylan esterase [Tepidisphaeraceae bacterium]|nr:acetylxylan esterase [Tepidisphaeraceae bacterium]